MNVPEEALGKVLVVDDEKPLRALYGRTLEMAGFEARLAASGDAALEALASSAPDEISVIVADINMPGMDGMEMVRAVRERGLDTPVVLVTGDPTVSSAAKAVEYGATRYLVKPVAGEDLVEAVRYAARLHRIAALNRHAAAHRGSVATVSGDRAGLDVTLSRGIESLWMAYQPIVNPVRREVVAYEALVRTREPSVPNPGVLFAIAERLGRVHEVGAAIRADVAGLLAAQRPEHEIYLNLHPLDLLDPDLYAPGAPLTTYARQVVLEITERAALEHVVGLSERIAALRALGYRVAVDDLGAGYSGLNYFAMLSPEVVKIDMSLVRDLHRDAVKRKIVGSLCKLCQELGMLVVAEGVEVVEEADAAVALGCDLVQGYFFAKPGPAYPPVRWAPEPTSTP